MNIPIVILLVLAPFAQVYSIKCWSCGYAEDENGNRIEIPTEFQDQSVPFCGDFINENKMKNQTKEYPKVKVISLFNQWHFQIVYIRFEFSSNIFIDHTFK